MNAGMAKMIAVIVDKACAVGFPAPDGERAQQRGDGVMYAWQAGQILIYASPILTDLIRQRDNPEKS